MLRSFKRNAREINFTRNIICMLTAVENTAALFNIGAVQVAPQKSPRCAARPRVRLTMTPSSTPPSLGNSESHSEAIEMANTADHQPEEYQHSDQVDDSAATSKSAFRKFISTKVGRRAILLISLLFIANILLWVAALLVAKLYDSSTLLATALLVWTLGLKHAVDVDHISAIDGVTRSLVSMGQLPVTVGFYFALGHSVVILCAVIVLVALVASLKNVAGFETASYPMSIAGTSVSAAFLLLISAVNGVQLWKYWLEWREERRTGKNGNDTTNPTGVELELRTVEVGEDGEGVGKSKTSEDLNLDSTLFQRAEGTTFIAEFPLEIERTITTDPTIHATRRKSRAPSLSNETFNQNENSIDVSSPTSTLPPPSDPNKPAITSPFLKLFPALTNLISRPSRTFYVGLLLSLSFDTALNLVALSWGCIPNLSAPSAVLVLPLLFAVAMILVDSADGILMLAIYTMPGLKRSRSWDMIITGMAVAVAVSIAAVQLVKLVDTIMGVDTAGWAWAGAVVVAGFLITSILAVIGYKFGERLKRKQNEKILQSAHG